MDDLCFDQLVKRLSAQRTRRTSLQALAGGALATVLLADASTDAKKKKKKCKAPKVKCGRKRCCAAGQQCLDGACVTPATSTSNSAATSTTSGATSTTTSTSTSTSTSTTTSQPSVCTPPCAAGLQCVDEECVCDVILCDTLNNPNPGQTSCNCTETTGGLVLCIAQQLCGGFVACGAGGTCAAGFVCQTNGCGGNPTCVKTCV